MYFFLSYLKEIPLIKTFLIHFKEDRDTIKYHWDNDENLIFWNRVALLMFFLSFCCVAYVILKMYQVEDIFNIEPIGPTVLYFFFSFFFFGLLIKFFGEIYIIFYRNKPIRQKIISCGIGCFKIVAYSSVVSIPIIEVASNTPLITPNPMINWYQVYTPTGRGYYYSSNIDMVRDQILKRLSFYDSNLLISNNKYSVLLESAFIESNKKRICKELSMAECQTLGFKKGWIL